MSTGWFITGTDTDVGKTHVAAAFVCALTRAGYAAVGMKPVATGWKADDSESDVARIRRCGVPGAALEDLSPYRFEEPVAPHIAAAQSGVEIRLEVIRRHFDRLAQASSWMVVEGVGGWRAPLNERESVADLARLLALPVILVVGMRLGCLNHALLSAEAIESDGLKLAGWVANRIEPGMRNYAENRAYLTSRIRAPLLVEFPHAPWDRAPTLAVADALAQSLMNST